MNNLYKKGRKMKIKLLLASMLAIGSVLTVHAADKPMSVKEKIKWLKSLSPEERARYKYEQTGGQVYSEAKGRPFIVVDLRAVNDNTLNIIKHGNTQLKETVPGLPMKMMSMGRNNENIEEQIFSIRDSESASLVVALVDNGTSTGLTVLPEERIAIINAGKYGNKEDRIVKEVWRAIGFIAGAGFSIYPADPMQPVFKNDSLDKLTGSVLLPMSLANMQHFNNKFGVVPSRRVPYILALKQGWGPMPTNAVQRAIYERVQADKERGPTNPLKIPMPKRK